MLTVARLRVGRFGDLLKRYATEENFLSIIKERRALIFSRPITSTEMGSEETSNGELSVLDRISLITKNLQVL